MPPEPRGTARERLLDRVVAHVLDRGVSDLSLRELATAIGSSHRMLLHHFGSREGLLAAVVQAIEAQQRAALDELAGDDLAALARDWWRRLSDPALWPAERLFFEIYGLGLQGRPGATALLDGIVDAWIEPAAALHEARGLDPAAARTRARLGLAVTRGLLLDLLATGDAAATTAAWEDWIRLDLGG